jgi:hypothetical protein
MVLFFCRRIFKKWSYFMSLRVKLCLGMLVEQSIYNFFFLSGCSVYKMYMCLEFFFHVVILIQVILHNLLF